MKRQKTCAKLRNPLRLTSDPTPIIALGGKPMEAAELDTCSNDNSLELEIILADDIDHDDLVVLCKPQTRSSGREGMSSCDKFKFIP